MSCGCVLFGGHCCQGWFKDRTNIRQPCKNQGTGFTLVLGPRLATSLLKNNRIFWCSIFWFPLWKLTGFARTHSFASFHGNLSAWMFKRQVSRLSAWSKEGRVTGVVSMETIAMNITYLLSGFNIPTISVTGSKGLQG